MISQIGDIIKGGTLEPAMSDREELILRFMRIRAATLGYLRALVRDAHLAEDLFQETYLVVMKKIDTFDVSSNFWAWVRTIALNLARNALGKSRYIHLVPSPELAQSIQNVYQGTPEEELLDSSYRLEHLGHCLEEVHPQHRNLLQMRYRQGASLKEMAKRLGRTAGAIQVALSRVRQALLRCMERREGLVKAS